MAGTSTYTSRSARHPGTAPATSTWPCVARQSATRVPQVQFNDDDVWHDFAFRPTGEWHDGEWHDGEQAALKAGSWFPCLELGARHTC